MSAKIEIIEEKWCPLLNVKCMRDDCALWVRARVRVFWSRKERECKGCGLMFVGADSALGMARAGVGQDAD